MKSSPAPKRHLLPQILFFLISVALGAVCGFLIAAFAAQAAGSTPGPGFLLLLFILFYLIFFLHIILHEAGHMVFGLLTGYHFCSFRIGSLMLIKKEGHFRLRRHSVAGTSGQCLMAPPGSPTENYPVILYNLGGSLMNFISALLAFFLYLIYPKNTLLSILLLLFILIGVGSALLNGIPLRLSSVNNDGCNTLELMKNPAARRAFWIQLKANEQISLGVSLGDMPEEWFTLPADEDMKNSLVATLGVFAANRLLEQHRFQESEALMEHLLSIPSGILGLYRGLLTCDRMYISLLETGTVPEAYDTKAQKKLMNSMKKSPSVLRTEYTRALLEARDSVKATAIRQKFDQYAKTHPYPSDIETERVLMALADEKAGL